MYSFETRFVSQRVDGRFTIFESLPRRAKTLWVSSSGGHLAEALKIDELINPDVDSLWVTFDTAQTRSMLSGRRVEYVDYVAPRDLRGSFASARRIRSIVKRESFEACISTGAAVAGLALPTAALSGVPTFYVESLARATGPSTTGRILRAAPKVKTLTQYPSWASATWRYDGTILDGWEARNRQPREGSRRILVTLGTIRPFMFDRAIRATLQLIRSDDEVVWQLGASMRGGLPGEVHSELPADELARIAEKSDVVVAHAGVGSILQLLELGKAPVLVVREKRFNEHVDDHQAQIADAIAERGLAHLLDLENPSNDTFDAAMSTWITAIGEEQNVS